MDSTSILLEKRTKTKPVGKAGAPHSPTLYNGIAEAGLSLDALASKTLNTLFRVVNLYSASLCELPSSAKRSSVR